MMRNCQFYLSEVCRTYMSATKLRLWPPGPWLHTRTNQALGQGSGPMRFISNSEQIMSPRYFKLNKALLNTVLHPKLASFLLHSLQSWPALAVYKDCPSRFLAETLNDDNCFLAHLPSVLGRANNVVVSLALLCLSFLLFCPSSLLSKCWCTKFLLSTIFSLLKSLVPLCDALQVQLSLLLLNHFSLFH